jgi:hypothetical protein
MTPFALDLGCKFLNECATNVQMQSCRKKVLCPQEDAGPEHRDPRQPHAVRRHAVRLSSLAPPSAHGQGSEGQLQQPLEEWIRSTTFSSNGTRKKISCSFFYGNRRIQTPTDFSFIYVKKSKQSYTELWARTEKRKIENLNAI